MYKTKLFSACNLQLWNAQSLRSARADLPCFAATAQPSPWSWGVRGEHTGGPGSCGEREKVKNHMQRPGWNQTSGGSLLQASWVPEYEHEAEENGAGASRSLKLHCWASWKMLRKRRWDLSSSHYAWKGWLPLKALFSENRVKPRPIAMGTTTTTGGRSCASLWDRALTVGQGLRLSAGAGSVPRTDQRGNKQIVPHLVTVTSADDKWSSWVGWLL